MPPLQVEDRDALHAAHLCLAWLGIIIIVVIAITIFIIVGIVAIFVIIIIVVIIIFAAFTISPHLRRRSSS